MTNTNAAADLSPLAAAKARSAAAKAKRAAAIEAARPTYSVTKTPACGAHVETVMCISCVCVRTN